MIYTCNPKPNVLSSLLIVNF